jgi:hypothetical protein
MENTEPVGTGSAATVDFGETETAIHAAHATELKRIKNLWFKSNLSLTSTKKEVRRQNAFNKNWIWES